MLKDMDAVKIPITFDGAERYLLYNLNSRLYLEYMTDYEALQSKNPNEWNLDESFHYLRAMLLDSFYEENKQHIENRDFAKCRPTLTEIGRWLDFNSTDELIDNILKAIVVSVPSSPIKEDENF